jgi:large conductance mechanosensitive channel
MPPLGLVLGKIDFSNLFINLGDKPVKTVAEAKAANVPTVNYGVFIDSVIQFLILAFVVFLLVRLVSRFYAPAAPTKACPYCAELIPVAAKKCGRCTSDLTATPAGAFTT